MTTEANDNDPRVSEAYRTMATETTPADLDNKILSMAADTGRSGFGLSRAWFRPIAWAATIGLSLAFVLEMSQFNDVAEPTASADSDESRLQQEFDMRSDADVEAKASSSPAAVEVEPAEGAASVSEDFAADEMLLLQEAEEQARARAGPSRAVVANSPAAALTLKKEEASLCEDSARRSAASWYACVEEMRKKDLDEAAALEMEALLIEFPDFQVPEGNR